MKQLLIATRNKGKLKELQTLLADLPYELKSLDDVGIQDEVKETGSTFEENARIKAIHYGDKAKMLTLADDSGLEVDELNGKPGIYSARYVEGTDLDRANKVLEELSDTPDYMRTGRFKSLIILYDPQTKITHSFEGVCEGYISREIIGTNGFGYDPIFYSTDLEKVFGEATEEEKNRVSHRGIALNQVKEFLEQ
jgi:XTP/dITP diphosphohydrolase